MVPYSSIVYNVILGQSVFYIFFQCQVFDHAINVLAQRKPNANYFKISSTSNYLFQIFLFLKLSELHFQRKRVKM